MDLRWLIVAAILIGVAIGLVAVWYGSRRWGRWEVRAIVVIALVILRCLAAATAILIPFDFYIHDTYFTLLPRSLAVQPVRSGTFSA